MKKMEKNQGNKSYNDKGGNGHNATSFPLFLVDYRWHILHTTNYLLFLYLP